VIGATLWLSAVFAFANQTAGLRAILVPVGQRLRLLTTRAPPIASWNFGVNLDGLPALCLAATICLGAAPGKTYLAIELQTVWTCGITTELRDRLLNSALGAPLHSISTLL
jgi:hypothetical protein